jgi:hypothetical protein
MPSAPCHDALSRRRWPGLLVAWAALAGCVAPEDANQPVALEGRIQRLVVSPRDPAKGVRRTAYVLETREHGDVELVFPTRAAATVEADLAPGAVLEVHGRRLLAAPGRPAPGAVLGYAQQVAVETWRQVLAAPVETAVVARSLILDPSAPPPVPRKVAVVLLNFQDDPSQNPTVDLVRNHVFMDARSTAVFYKEQSYGQIVLGGKADPMGDVFGYFTIPFNSSPCLEAEWSKAALEVATAMGKDLSGYDHTIFVFTSTSSCQYNGVGMQKGKTTWINGLRADSKRLNHEIGHNFDHLHASSVSCTDTGGQRVAFGSNCTESEYGNPFDIMGLGPRHTNMVNKARARWAAGSNIKEVTATGTYDLVPGGVASNSVQLLRVAGGNDKTFYVEYRQPAGMFDDFPPDDPGVTGVMLHVGPSNGEAMTVGLIDTTPDTSTFNDAPLGVGKTFEDPSGGAKITLVERTPQVAKVKVELPGGGMMPPPAGGPDGGGGPAPSPDAANPPTNPPPTGGADAGAAPPPPTGGTGGGGTPPPGATADASTAPGKLTPIGCECHFGRGTGGVGGAIPLGLALAVVALATRAGTMRRRSRERRGGRTRAE